MRLDVSPFSLWVAYPLTKPSVVRDMLPPHLKLANGRLLSDDDDKLPANKLLFNAYEIGSPWMRGVRVDTLVLAKDRKSGSARLVVLDCLTNTLRWDPENGPKRQNAFNALLKTTRAGCYSIKVCGKNSEFKVGGTIGKARPIDWKFAVEGNRVCFFRSNPRAFRMTFNETLVAQPVLQLTDTSIKNTLWSSIRSTTPSHAFVHPHGMSFDIDLDTFRVWS
jgi:hypothetical protein